MQNLRQLTLLLAFSFLTFAWKASADELIFPHYNFSVATTDKSPIKLNTHTSLIVTLLPTSKAAPAVKGFSFDAKMPQHKHGMVTTPKITKVSDLEYRVEGVRLHMAGIWVFEFTAQHPVGDSRVFSAFEIAAK